MKGILDDPDTRAALRTAFVDSVRAGSEYGFWIGQSGNNYFAYPIYTSNLGPFIDPWANRPPTSDIFAHGHPFTYLAPGLSNHDVQIAARNHILIISIGWQQLIDWADYRN